MIRIYPFGEVSPEDVFARVEPKVDVEAIVADIIRTVREQGDRALYAYTEQFDKARLSSLQVTQEEMDEAVALVDPDFLRIRLQCRPERAEKLCPAGSSPQNKQSLVFQRIHSIYNIVITVQIKRIRSFITIYRLNSFNLCVRVYLQ